jgi:hypothetical protein
MPSEIRDNGILLADDWKLVPIDSRNWELCQRYVSQARGRHKGGTEPTWHHCGRFYSSNTIDCALLYVADNLMKDKCRDAALTLDAAVAEWKATIRELERAVVGKVSA